MTTPSRLSGKNLFGIFGDKCVLPKSQMEEYILNTMNNYTFILMKVVTVFTDLAFIINFIDLKHFILKT